MARCTRLPSAFRAPLANLLSVGFVRHRCSKVLPFHIHSKDHETSSIHVQSVHAFLTRAKKDKTLVPTSLGDVGASHFIFLQINVLRTLLLSCAASLTSYSVRPWRGMTPTTTENCPKFQGHRTQLYLRKGSCSRENHFVKIHKKLILKNISHQIF